MDNENVKILKKPIPKDHEPKSNSVRPKSAIVLNKNHVNLNKFQKLSDTISTRPKSSNFNNRQKNDFYHSTVSNFGKDAPHISIGSSRPPPIIPYFTPGPGTYDIPKEIQDRRITPIFHSISRENKPPITINVPFTITHQFPEIRPQTIGTKDSRKYYQISETPGPTYIPQPIYSSSKGHKILSRISHKEPNPSIGPGTYSPQDPSLSSAPSFTLRGPETRDFWLGQKNSFPGPGHYSPNSDIQRDYMHSWSFGSKSRKHRNYMSSTYESNFPKKKGKLIPMGIYNVRLSSKENEESAMKYISSHPELCTLFDEVTQIILKTKIDYPLDILRDYFENLRSIRDKEREKKRNYFDSQEEFEISTSTIPFYISEDSEDDIIMQTGGNTSEKQSHSYPIEV